MTDSTDAIPSHFTSPVVSTDSRPVTPDSPGDPIDAGPPASTVTPAGSAASRYAADTTDLRALAAHWVGVLREERLFQFTHGFSCGTSEDEVEAHQRLPGLRAALGDEVIEAVWAAADARTRAELGEAKWHAFRHGGRGAWEREEDETMRRARWEGVLTARNRLVEAVLVTADGRPPARVAPEAWEAALAAAFRGGWLPDEDPVAARPDGAEHLTAAQAEDLAAAMAWPARRSAYRGGMDRALRLMRAGPVGVRVVRRAADALAA